MYARIAWAITAAGLLAALAGCASVDGDGLDGGLAKTCPGLDGMPTTDQEDICLRAVGPRVSREGPVLTLKSDEGSPVTLVDRLADCGADAKGCTRFRLAGWIESSQVYVVAVGGGCGQTLLVSSRTGEQVEILGEPHLSQGGGRVIAVQSAPECEAPYDIGVWTLDKGAVRTEWKYTSNKTSRFAFVSWESEDRALLTDTRDMRKPQTAKTYRSAAVVGPRGWRLETTTKPATPPAQ